MLKQSTTSGGFGRENNSDSQTNRLHSRLPIPKKSTCSTTANAQASVPDFQSIHKTWEQNQQQLKQKLKKKPTIPKEFSFASSNRTKPISNTTTTAAASAAVKPKVISNTNGNTRHVNSHQVKPIRTATVSASDLRRKSLGPPRRALSSLSTSSSTNSAAVSIDERRRTILVNRSNHPTHSQNISNSNQQEDVDENVPMSKLERRISTYFSKPASSTSSSIGSSSSASAGQTKDGLANERIETRIGLALMDIQRGTPGKSIRKPVAAEENDQLWMQKLAQDVLKRSNESTEQSNPQSKQNPPEIADLVPTPPPPLGPSAKTDRKEKKTGLSTAKAKIYESGFETKICHDEDLTFQLPVPILHVPVGHDAPKEKSIHQLKRSQSKLFENASASPACSLPKLSLFSVPVPAIDESECDDHEVKFELQHLDSDNYSHNQGDNEDEEGDSFKDAEEETCQFYFNGNEANFDIQKTSGDFIVPPTPLALNQQSVMTNKEQELSDCDEETFMTPFKTAIDPSLMDGLLSSPDEQDQMEIMKQLENLKLLESEILKDLNSQIN